METKPSLAYRLSHMPREYYILSALLFLFFVSWAGCYSLLAIWLQRFFHLSGQETGFTYAVFSVTAFCLQPVYGFIQDKLVLRRNLIFYLGVLLSLCGPYYIFVCEPLLETNTTLGGVAVGVYMGLAYQAGIGVLESYTERFGRRTGFEYGHARMWGSLGWAATVAVTGIFINIDPHINFWLSTAAGLVFLALLSALKTSKYSLSTPDDHPGTGKKQSGVTLQQAVGLLSLPKFWALALFVCSASIYLVYDQQFMVYYSHMFDNPEEGTEMYGYLNSVQVFLESGCTFLAPFLINRIGAKRGLLLGGTIMFLRIFLSGMVESTVALSCVKLLHGPEVPIVMISVFKYITTRFNPALSATMYLVGYQMVSQVISAVLAPVAGYGYDKFGFADTYIAMSVVVLVSVVISAFLLTGKTVAEEQAINKGMEQVK